MPSRFAVDPVDRSSMPTTSWPRASEPLAHVGADEACCSGDEYPHRSESYRPLIGGPGTADEPRCGGGRDTSGGGGAGALATAPAAAGGSRAVSTAAVRRARLPLRLAPGPVEGGQRLALAIVGPAAVRPLREFGGLGAERVPGPGETVGDDGGAAQLHRERGERDAVDVARPGDLHDVGGRPEPQRCRRRGVDAGVQQTTHRVERGHLPFGDLVGDQPIEQRRRRHRDPEVAGDEGEVQVDLDTVVTDQRDVLAVAPFPARPERRRHPVEPGAFEGASASA